MRNRRFLVPVILIAAAAAGQACQSDNVTAASNGHVLVKLTDAPFPTDSVDSVIVFVKRIDIRMTAADSAAADSAIAADSATTHGWLTVAEPDTTYNLLDLQNGTSVTLGQASVAAAHYSAIRMVIDPSRSRVVLKNGTVLTGISDPGVKFPSGSTSGLKVTVNDGVDVAAGDTTTVVLDFNLSESFVMRGNSIAKLGLLFKPVIMASVATTN